jgi:hypothetical protein
MTRLKIKTQWSTADHGEKWEIVELKETDDGWKVNTELIDGEGWRLYAVKEAREIDVRQLLRKEYDCRY